MVSFNPSLTLNIGRRKNEPKQDKPIEGKRERPLEAPKEVPVPQTPTIVQVDSFQLLLILLAVAVVLLSAAAFVHAARA